ncbi:MAG: PDZ domain-containing protein, partial [Acidobacteriota bacterium]
STSATAHQAGSISIQTVFPGSPAAAAGIEPDDRLVELAGRPITTHQSLRDVMAAHQPGDTVALVVERRDERIDLSLRFGERPEGGVSIGVTLAIEEAAANGEPDAGTTECLAWIESTYKIESLMHSLELDLTADYETLRTCVGRDARRMGRERAVRFCDNIFKVHCSGVDLLTEIGEAQVDRCEASLGHLLGIRVQDSKAWKTCGQHKVFDHYAEQGKSSDEAACRSAFLDCGTRLDAAVAQGKLSSEQRVFVDCCSAAALPAVGAGEARCGVLDEGFERGPCHDRPVCVNRLTDEWITCSESP